MIDEELFKKGPRKKKEYTMVMRSIMVMKMKATV